MRTIMRDYKNNCKKFREKLQKNIQELLQEKLGEILQGR